MLKLQVTGYLDIYSPQTQLRAKLTLKWRMVISRDISNLGMFGLDIQQGRTIGS
jgi:hypothetical protein